MKKSLIVIAFGSFVIGLMGFSHFFGVRDMFYMFFITLILGVSKYQIEKLEVINRGLSSDRDRGE